VEGAPIDIDQPSVLASNGLIHDEMLKVIAEVRAR
jgi:hypothetical protein